MIQDDFKIKNVRQKKSDTQQIIFEGDLGIFNAEKIQKKLNRFKIDAQKVELILKNIENIDMSTIQFILALKRSQENQSKKLEVMADVPDSKCELLYKTGFKRIIENWN